MNPLALDHHEIGSIERPSTCLIADDHPLVLRSVAELVREWGLTVVATTTNGGEALRKITDLRPDAALVDLHMPGVSGIDLVRALPSDCTTSVLIYTGHDDQGCVGDALDAGARGVILKEAPLDDLRRALEVVLAGGVYIDPVLSSQLVVGPSQLGLTHRERDVLRLLADGCSNDEIGEKLFISSETVRTHVAKATRKLGARTRTQAVACALRAGVIG